MDDRKKRINELELRKKEQGVLLEELYINFGEIIFVRMSDSAKFEQENASVLEELTSYERFQVDIANSQASIQVAEEDIRRSKELDAGIEDKEREKKDNATELAIVYGRLGKMLLGANDGSIIAFCAEYRDQNEALFTKVFSLEERLDELDKKEGGNVLTWIGKSAQNLVLRSFLSKAQENLEQLRRKVGEHYSRQSEGRLLSGETYNDNDGETSDDINVLCAEIEQKRVQSNVFSEDIVHLREERQQINGNYSSEGGPVRYINTLKNSIVNLQSELKVLYRRVGAESASIRPMTTSSERKQIIDSLVIPQDQEIFDRASRINQNISDCDKEINKLQASIAIDEEKNKIEKLRKMIQDKQDKIAKAEKGIKELEEGIRDSEACIEKLRDLL
jgi:hypothetical protein